MSDVFGALADPTRRAILKSLAGGDATAGELAERFPLARSTLSGHCRVLKEAGLVLTEKHANRVVYSLNTTVAHEAAAAVADLFAVGGPRAASKTAASSKTGRRAHG